MVSLCERRSDNAWIPYSLKHNYDVNNNAEETIRTIRGVLNKVTAKKFDLLLQDLKESDIWNDKETLTEMVSVIFKQAIQGPLYVNLYADLCLHIHQTENESNKDQRFFLGRLIRKLQTIFEDVSGNPDAGLETGDVMTEMKKKRDLIGLIRFVAQLYRVKLLNFKIIENCLVIYLRTYDQFRNELLLESAVLLLLNVGPLVRSEVERNIMDGYSHYCERYKADVCKRIRFKLDDLVRLRGNRWVGSV